MCSVSTASFFIFQNTFSTTDTQVNGHPEPASAGFLLWLPSTHFLYHRLTMSFSSPVSIQTQSLALRALRKRKPQETQALALEFSRNKRKRQPIGMLGRSSGNHDWLLTNTSACVSCGFRLRNARNASDCIWMETGLHNASLSMSNYTKEFHCYGTEKTVKVSRVRRDGVAAVWRPLRCPSSVTRDARHYVSDHVTVGVMT